jgi:hypothetical protein
MIQPSSAGDKVDVRGDISQVNGGAAAVIEQMWQGWRTGWWGRLI